MKYHVDYDSKHFDHSDLKVVAAFEKTNKDGDKTYQVQWSTRDLTLYFKDIKASDSYTGAKEVHLLSLGQVEKQFLWLEWVKRKMLKLKE
jgi:hypothetical protein